MTPDALARIHATAFTDTRAWSAEEIAALSEGAGVFVISDQQGFVIGRVTLDEVELLTIAVSPETQRQGQGRRLLRDFATTAEALGARRAFLEVAADNVPALSLYTGEHWQEAGRRKKYYQRRDGTRVDALLLERRLRG